MTRSTANPPSKNEGSLPKVGYWRRDLEGMRQRRLRAAELFHLGATQAEVAHLVGAWALRRWRGLLYRVRDVHRAAGALICLGRWLHRVST